MPTSTPKSLPSSRPEFDGHEVRWTPDGRAVAIDCCAALGFKNPTRAWQNLKETHGPDFLPELGSYSFGGRGRPPEVLSERGVYKLAMVAGGPKAAEFREWAADLIKRYRTADEFLAGDLIDRQTDPEVLARLEVRARTKISGGALEKEIGSHGGVNLTYALAHDANNRLATGASSSQLRKRHKTDRIRDHLDRVELTKLNTAQVLETVHIQNTGPKGHKQILDRQQEVINDLAPVFEKYRPRKATSATMPPLLPLSSTDVAPMEALRPARTAEELEVGRRFFKKMKDKLAEPKPKAPVRPDELPWSKHLAEP